jgi:hypothetical protein
MSKGKIGIFAPAAHGDMALSMCVLKYKDLLWPNKDIVWFASKLPDQTYIDMLKFNDAVAEVRHWPEGYRLPERCPVDGPKAVAAGLPMWEDFSILQDANGHLHEGFKMQFESTKDLDGGYFPTPWQNPKRPIGMHYADVPKMVFGVDKSYIWHPYLCFSDEEREMARAFCAKLPHSKTIMLETFMKSGDVHWNEEMTRSTMQLCREKFGKCNFIFASLFDRDKNSKFFDDDGVVSTSQFTVRQNALIYNHCDLFIGVCSGISIAVSCWGNKPVPRIEWCGSPPISMGPITNGPLASVFYDDLPLNIAEYQLKGRIKEALSKM